jgi:hypothetical protein
MPSKLIEDVRDFKVNRYLNILKRAMTIIESHQPEVMDSYKTLNKKLLPIMLVLRKNYGKNVQNSEAIILRIAYNIYQPSKVLYIFLFID